MRVEELRAALSRSVRPGDLVTWNPNLFDLDVDDAYYDLLLVVSSGHSEHRRVKRGIVAQETYQDIVVLVMRTRRLRKVTVPREEWSFLMIHRDNSTQ